jgi:enoyl-CoA hydratase
MQRKFENVILNIEEGIATILLNRPQAMNALCDALNTDLLKAIGCVCEDTAIRVLILTGSGKAFAAGADIKEMMSANQFDAERTARKAHSINDALETLPIPVIAAVNGPALGGGCEIALSCDFRVAGENSAFGLPEVGLGIIPGAGGTQRLTKLIGPVRAKEVVMAGKIIKGKEAYEIGLVTKCVPDEEVLEQAFALAKQIICKPAAALQYAKAAINYAVDNNVQTGSEYEKSLFSLCFETEDQKEGMKAFVEKRKPDFTNNR